MALDDRSRRLLGMILDLVQEDGWFPPKEPFRARLDLDKADRAALRELTGRYLRGPDLAPTIHALREMRGVHAFAVAELARAKAMVPILHRQYREAFYEKEHLVADVATELHCEPNDVRRAMLVLPVKIIAWWDVSDGGKFERYKLMPEVLDLAEDEIEEAPGEVDDQVTLDTPEPDPDFTLVEAILAGDAHQVRETAFDARAFHDAVVSSGRPLFVDGYPREAVESATRILLDLVKKRTGLTIDGEDLVNLVFSEKNPLLRLNDGKTETERSEQRGAGFLAKTIVALLRNPNAHEYRVHAEEHALECLTLLSLFYRYLDQMR